MSENILSKVKLVYEKKYIFTVHKLSFLKSKLSNLFISIYLLLYKSLYNILKKRVVVNV